MDKVLLRMHVTYKPIGSTDYITWQWDEHYVTRDQIEPLLDRRRQKIGGIGMSEYQIWTMESHDYVE